MFSLLYTKLSQMTSYFIFLVNPPPFPLQWGVIIMEAKKLTFLVDSVHSTPSFEAQIVKYTEASIS